MLVLMRPLSSLNQHQLLLTPAGRPLLQRFCGASVRFRSTLQVRCPLSVTPTIDWLQALSPRDKQQLDALGGNSSSMYASSPAVLDGVARK
jgi:hypothetical protein